MKKLIVRIRLAYLLWLWRWKCWRNRPKLLRIDERDCEHGHQEIKRYSGTLSYMCPVANCKCCGEFFGWIDSVHGGGGGNGSGGKSWMPDNTCSFCGGHYQYWGNWEGVEVMVGDTWTPVTEAYPEKYANLPSYEDMFPNWEKDTLEMLEKFK